MVVLFHARLPMPGGFAGVDVFFVISGFVITAMLAREWRQEGEVRLRRFYLRRYLRLAPALASMLAFTTLASLVLLSPFGPQQSAAATALGALALSANLVVARSSGDYFAPDAIQNPLLHTWSLAVEEQFYLIYPAILLSSWHFTRGRRLPTWGVFAVVASLCLASFAIGDAWLDGSPFAAWLTRPLGGPEVFAFYGLPARAWELGAGCLLALGLAESPPPRRGLAEVAGLSGVALVALSAFTLDESARFPGAEALLPVVGTVLLLVAGSGSPSVVSRALATKPLVRIGDWSYSIYLWHWPLIVFAGIVWPQSHVAPMLAAGCAFLPACLSYRFLERPLREFRNATAVGMGAVVLATSVAPALIAGGLLSYAFRQSDLPDASTLAFDSRTSPGVDRDSIEPASLRSTGRNASIADQRSATRKITRRTTMRGLRFAHVAFAAGCVDSAIDPKRCRFGPSPARGTLLLLGDSQAYAIADGLIDAAQSLGYAVVVSSRTGCPFLGRDSSGRNRLDCPSWQQAALRFALETRPVAVVIANRSAGYIHPDRGWRTAVRDDGKRARNVEEATQLWRRGIEGVVEPLRDAGIPVVLIAAVAELPKFDDGRSLFAQVYQSRPYEVALEQVVADRAPALAVERAVVESHPHAMVFDPLPTLCTDVCASAAADTMLYQDATHLSVDGALRLSAPLRESLSRFLRPEAASS